MDDGARRDVRGRACGTPWGACSMSAMIVPLVPDEGWVVLHLFCKATPRSDGEAVSRAVKAAEEGGQTGRQLRGARS